MSPFLAAVMLIAVTLVASTAIGGFMFGTIGSSANTARVQVIRTALPASVGLGVTYVYCATSTGNSVGDGIIQLYNSGTKSTEATFLNLVYDGSTVNVALTGPCNVNPQSTVYLIIVALPYLASRGVHYGGYVSTGNGAEVLFTGAFG